MMLPTNEADQVMLTLFSKGFPCRQVNDPSVHILLLDVGFARMSPDAPIRLLSTCRDAEDSLFLLAEVAQGGSLELAPLLLLRCIHETEQRLPPSLFLTVRVAVAP